MIAKVRPIIGLYTLAVVLLFLLGSHAIAACDSCKASKEGTATGLLEAGGPSISEGTSSGAENINLVDAPVGATPSLYKPSKPLKPEGPDQGYLIRSCPLQPRQAIGMANISVSNLSGGRLARDIAHPVRVLFHQIHR
jgi:hypothetical protein